MFLHIQDVLTADEVALFRQRLWAADAPWVDGARSAGGQAVHQKNNLQLAQGSDLSAQLQGLVKAALHRNALFFSAALPRRIYNPLFNKYGDGSNYYGNHVDSAVMHSKADNCWVRSDLSCTLFLTAPEDYDGGELVISEALGEKRIKLPAGDMVLYPSSTVHQVAPVTRGHRISSFFWVKAWCAGWSSASCCSTWTCRYSSCARRMARKNPRSSRYRARTTTCCACGPMSECHRHDQRL